MPYLGYQQIDCSTPAVHTGTELVIPSGSYRAELQAQAEGDVNYTMDGETIPGASHGMILRATDPPKDFIIEDIVNIKFTKSGADTKLNVHYYGKAIN